MPALFRALFRVLRHFFRRPLSLCALALTGLAGCASQDLEAYAAEQPAFDLASYFSGKVLAHGIFQNRSGQVVRRFSVDIDGRWEGENGVLDEHFTYADGHQERRVWHLTRHADGHYSGTADDVVGTATGRVAGNTLHWTYSLNLPVDGSVYEVQFDDWMYRMNERVVINRASMHKFGLRLGEVTLTFEKVAP